jgi:hypothetical protein
MGKTSRRKKVSVRVAARPEVIRFDENRRMALVCSIAASAALPGSTR